MTCDSAAEMLKTSKFGFGCMRLPQTDPADVTAIDIDELKKMVDAFMESGGTYFDTAYVYHNGCSETALREALVERYPRESYTIATKSLAWVMPSKEAAHQGFFTSLERLGVDYVDYFLLHNISGQRAAKFDEYDMWEFVKGQKEAGRIKHVGFSMHDTSDALERVLTEHPEMEFVQLQVNYVDWDDPVTDARRNMEIAAAHGVPVMIMEPARGGRLINLPERVASILTDAYPEKSLASWAYRFCYNLPNVVTVLSGVSNLQQMQQNIADFAANEPFAPEEKAVLDAAIAEMKSVETIPCTACRYCVKECPQHVMIPEILGLLNEEAITGDHGFVKTRYSWAVSEGYASRCIRCGLCEGMCPQKISIIEELERATELYE